MTEHLLDPLLADPETHAPLRRASEADLEALATAIREGRARRKGGGPLPSTVEGGYVSQDGRWIYPDVDGLPSLLVDERIELG